LYRPGAPRSTAANVAAAASVTSMNDQTPGPAAHHRYLPLHPNL
jgi:hypothetical protein